MAKLENAYQSDLVNKLETMFPDIRILKNDPNYVQGIADLILLNGNRYAILEVKKDRQARHQPNQDWYVNRFNQMGACANFIYPENETHVLDNVASYFFDYARV